MESGFEAAAWAGGSYAAGSETIYDLSWFWPAACEDILVGYLLKRCGGWGKEKSERREEEHVPDHLRVAKA